MSGSSPTWISYIIGIALAIVGVLISVIVVINWPEHTDWLAWGLASIVALLCLFALAILPIPRIVIERRMGSLGPAVVSPEKVLEAENGVRTGLLQAIGAIIVAVGLGVTITQVSLTSRGAQDQLALTLKGQVSDRFTKAIEELGDANVDVRLGGIYVIDRIAADSKDYRPTLAAVLSAFVRRNAARARDKDGEYTPEPLQYAPLDARKPDIQAAITVLGEEGMPGSSLVGTDIQGADLSSTNIWGNDFTDADMTFAIFRRVNDPGGPDAAVLKSVYMYGAIFDEADLTDVKMIDAILEKATFHDSMLTRIDFTNANLAHADFEGARLDRVNFSGVDLTTCTGISAAEYENAVKDDHTFAPKEFAPR